MLWRSSAVHAPAWDSLPIAGALRYHAYRDFCDSLDNRNLDEAKSSYNAAWQLPGESERSGLRRWQSQARPL